jgi:hypothetical protein
MKLASGLKIDDPRKLLSAFVRIWYPMYDGVLVKQDSKLTVPDIALCTMLNSRMSGNTGGEIWSARKEIEAGLAKIPAAVDLLDVPKGGAIPGDQGLSAAVTAMCNLHRVKVSICTKILHKKRPALLPIFDGVVEGYYWPRYCPSVRGRSYGDYVLALTACVHKDMLSVAPELRDLRNEMATNKTPLTACRILNVLTWLKRSPRKAAWFFREAKSLAEGKGGKAGKGDSTSMPA